MYSSPRSFNGIAIVGEAPGAEEQLHKKPFVGKAGKLLTEALSRANINRDDCLVTNVFQTRPPANDLAHFFTNKTEGIGPPISRGQYLRQERLGEIQAMYDLLQEYSPRIVIALGNTALWALTRQTGITKHRGTPLVAEAAFGEIPPYKICPSFHPAAVLRQWALWPVWITDLLKFQRQSHYPEVRRPNRLLYLDPTISDLPAIERACANSSLLAYDIETRNRQITCIGFAPSPHTAFVIPFVNPYTAESYWKTPAEEVRALETVKKILANSVPKVAQNGMYDMQYLWSYGIPVRNAQHDTMLAHHALQPELPKSLGFLGSVYTDETSWKLLPKKSATLKKDD